LINQFWVMFRVSQYGWPALRALLNHVDLTYCARLFFFLLRAC